MRSNTLAARLLPCALATVLVTAAPVAAGAQTAAAPDYSGYTAAGFIPFVPPPVPQDPDSLRRPGAHPRQGQPLQSDTLCRHPQKLLPFTCAVGFNVSIGGSRNWYTMDTGTTGIMVSAASIPGYRVDPAKDRRGWEFLSSSRILWVGHWTHMEVTFLDSANAAVAVATVPVLAVDSEAVCEEYKDAWGASCQPAGSPAGPLPPGMPSGLHPASSFIHYMGVGFGREDDGQPQGTPDKNPLLHITRIADARVAPGSIRSGYIITPRGVHVGLTATNTAGFVYTRLTPGSPTLPMNWGPPHMCVQVNGSRCMPGTTLIDTGINTMYISTPTLAGMSFDSIQDPSDSTRKVAVLAPGTQVTVRFPADTGQVAFYGFTVGDRTNALQPYVAMPVHDAGVFVNTGRHFYRAFNVLFDADGGYFGLRWIGGANSSNGGTTQGGS